MATKPAKSSMVGEETPPEAMQTSDLSPPKSDPKLYHSVLVEIGLIPSDGSKKFSQNSLSDESPNSIQRERTDQALDLLNHLLQTRQLTPESVRSAHCNLLSSSKQSSGEPVPAAAASNGKTLSFNSRTEADKSNHRIHSSGVTTLISSSSSNAAEAASPFLHFQRHVALQIYYDGARYSGLAETVGRESDKSIEREVFAALRKACLLEEPFSRESCKYSRCGRTDRGVSAAGQVLALKLKSAFRSDMVLVSTTLDGEQVSQPLTPDDLPRNGLDSLTVECPARRGTNKRPPSIDAFSNAAPKTLIRTMTEFPYDKILNNLLPEDIRVLGWCPVSPDFSARFSAASRTYRYFFAVRPTLDLEAVREALRRLEGTHDFRNFCKMDVEQVYNFRRAVHRADLVVVPGNEYGYFEIHGQAFLWHQIRCIASLLFLIGNGLESPDLVTELLDVDKHPGKPCYPLAPERPLVLHDCAYDRLRVGYSVQNLWTVSCLLERHFEDTLLAAARIRNCLERLREAANVRVQDLVGFASGKWQVRMRKQRRPTNVKAPDDRREQFMAHPFGDAELVPWSAALEWMGTLQLVPEPMAAVQDAAYIPVLQRSKGPTYEEKVANLQQSAKRRQRYETNVIKKRKTPEEDEAFYQHMTRQGGVSHD